MAAVTMQHVESRLGGVHCAVCKTNGFGIDPRSMRADGEWKGVCAKCRYTFPVHTDTDFYLRTQPDLPHRLREIPCPACESRGVDLDFRIVMSVREAYYFVTCTRCRHQFPERSFLEIFE